MQFRVPAWAVVVMVAAIPAVAGPAEAQAATPAGYPRCTPEGVAVAWAWYVDGARIATTEIPLLVLDDVEYEGDPDRCAEAAACLSKAGLTWKESTAIVGSTSGEALIGTDESDVIVALGGDDVVDAGARPDVVCAGAGDDIVHGGNRGDVLIGGNGNDVLRGGAGDDVLFGNGDTDVLFGGKGADELLGGPDVDGLYGASGTDLLNGGPGEDGCFGGGDKDRLKKCHIREQAFVRYGAKPYRGFTVQVEGGLGIDRDQAEAEIDRILGDARSWIGDGAAGFRRVGAGWDFRIFIAGPATVDALCAPLDTGGYLSCRNGSTVAVNADRWRSATSWWPAGITVYRQYLINHEVGHVLGNGHVLCPADGATAPVMMQQTKGLDGCVANGWVLPDG